jgi:hypothetical protein
MRALRQLLEVGPVLREEVTGARDAGQVGVVEDEEPARPQELPQEQTLRDDVVEQVVAVDEGEIDPEPLAHEPRKTELGALLVERHVFRQAGFLDVPEPEAVEARELERIDDDVAARSVLTQCLGDEERRHAVPESGLQARRRPQRAHQLEEVLAALGVDARRRHRIPAPVAVHDLLLAIQPLEDRVHDQRSPPLSLVTDEV